MDTEALYSSYFGSLVGFDGVLFPDAEFGFLACGDAVVMVTCADFWVNSERNELG